MGIRRIKLELKTIKMRLLYIIITLILLGGAIPLATLPVSAQGTHLELYLVDPLTGMVSDTPNSGYNAACSIIKVRAVLETGVSVTNWSLSDLVDGTNSSFISSPPLAGVGEVMVSGVFGKTQIQAELSGGENVSINANWGRIDQAQITDPRSVPVVWNEATRMYLPNASIDDVVLGQFIDEGGVISYHAVAGVILNWYLIRGGISIPRGSAEAYSIKPSLENTATYPRATYVEFVANGSIQGTNIITFTGNNGKSSVLLAAAAQEMVQCVVVPQYPREYQVPVTPEVTTTVFVPPDTLNVSGQVYELNNVTPINGAHIYAWTYKNYNWILANSALSDPGGNYSMELSPGQYRLKAFRSGYTPEWYFESASEVNAQLVTVADNTLTSGKNFTLSATPQVLGPNGTFDSVNTRMVMSIGAYDINTIGLFPYQSATSMTKMVWVWVTDQNNQMKDVSGEMVEWSINPSDYPFIILPLTGIISVYDDVTKHISLTDGYLAGTNGQSDYSTRMSGYSFTRKPTLYEKQLFKGFFPNFNPDNYAVAAVAIQDLAGPFSPGMADITISIHDPEEGVIIRTTSIDSLLVYPLGPMTDNISIESTSPLPGGIVGKPYSQTFSASGGTGTYSWSISSGSLPPGLSLNSSTGEITGIPGTTSTATFSISAGNLVGNATKELSITINLAPPIPVATTLSLTAEPINIIANGTSTSLLKAVVKDQNGNPFLGDIDVGFSSNHGTLVNNPGFGRTFGGIATATLISESSETTVIATVTASAGNLSDAVAVFFIPHGGVQVEKSQTEIIQGAGIIIKTPTGGDVNIDATGEHHITVAQYEAAPTGTSSFEASGKYYDVHLENGEGVNSLTVEFRPAASDTVIYYWGGEGWVPCFNQIYSNGCVTVTIDNTTDPSISFLTGGVFAYKAPNGPPIANAGGPYSGYEGVPVSFDGTASSDPNGGALTYEWTFGDGQTGTGAAINHTYSDSGSYVITLKVTNPGGLSGPISTTATIANLPPSVEAGPNQVQVWGLPVSFAGILSDPSPIDTGKGLNPTWAFGDGGTASGVNVTHIYTTTGNYTATLTATDKDGGIGSDTAKVTINKRSTTLAITSSNTLTTNSANVTAVIKDGAAPIIGKVISFTASNFSASGTTDVNGTASATLALPPGQYSLSANFAGDELYLAGNAVQPILYACQPTQFVIWGGNPDGVKVGQDYVFWGSQWAKQVKAGDYQANSSFKGYAETVNNSSKTWTAGSGNSSHPPATINSYISVIVSTHIAKNGSTISGNITEVVILKVDNPASFKPDPGSIGSGVVVAVVQ
jgi:PKD repeat protein